jgi:hypothetical protein
VHPYRVPGTLRASPRAGAEHGFFGVAFVLWLGSVLRTVEGALHRERFGRELSLALVLVIAIPWLARRWGRA